MDIKFSGYPNKQDYIKVFNLMNPKTKNRFTFSLWMFLLFIGGLLFTGGIRDILSPSRLDFLTIVYIFAGIVCISIGLGLRNYANQQWELNKPLHEHIEGSISEQEIELITPYGYSKFTWDDFDSYRNFSDFILLFRGISFFLFSRRYFQNNDDWQAFLNLASSNIKTTEPQAVVVKKPNKWIMIAIVFIITMSFTMFTVIRNLFK